MKLLKISIFLRVLLSTQVGFVNDSWFAYESVESVGSLGSMGSVGSVTSVSNVGNLGSMGTENRP